MEVKKKKKMNKLRCLTLQRDFQALVVREGWLYKLSRLKHWKKRWFVLSNFCLFYYKDSEESELLGSILLPSYQIKPWNTDLTQKFSFKAEHQNMKSFYLAAEGMESMKFWMNDLSLASIMFTSDISNSSLEKKDKESGFTSNHSKNNAQFNFGRSPCNSDQWKNQKTNSSSFKERNKCLYSDEDNQSNSCLTQNNVYQRCDNYNYPVLFEKLQDVPHKFSSSKKSVHSGANSSYSKSYFDSSDNLTTHFSKSFENILEKCDNKDYSIKICQPLYANAPPKPKRSQEIFNEEFSYDEKTPRSQSAEFLEKNVGRNNLSYSMEDIYSQNPKQESMKHLLEWKQRMLHSPLSKPLEKKTDSFSHISEYHQRIIDVQKHDSELDNDAHHQHNENPYSTQADYVNIKTIQRPYREDELEYFKREDYYRASKLFYDNSEKRLSNLSPKSSVLESPIKKKYIWDLDKDVGLPIPINFKPSRTSSIEYIPSNNAFNEEQPNFVQEKIKHFESSASKRTKFKLNSFSSPNNNSKIYLSLLSSALNKIHNPIEEYSEKNIDKVLNVSIDKEEEAYISMASVSEEEPVYVSMDDPPVMNSNFFASIVSAEKSCNKSHLNNLSNINNIKEFDSSDADDESSRDSKIDNINSDCNKNNEKFNLLLNKKSDFHSESKLENNKKIKNFEKNLSVLKKQLKVSKAKHSNISFEFENLEENINDSKLNIFTSPINEFHNLSDKGKQLPFNLKTPDLIPLELHSSPPYYYSDIFEENSIHIDEKGSKDSIICNQKAEKTLSFLSNKNKSSKVNRSSKSQYNINSDKVSSDFEELFKKEPCYENISSLPQNNELLSHLQEPVYENLMTNGNDNFHCHPLDLPSSPTLKFTLSNKGNLSGLQNEDVTPIPIHHEIEEAANISAGDLLGKSHEELILLLIKLKRNQSNMAMEIDQMNNQGYNKEHSELKLRDLKIKYKMCQPLVSLVDSMVKLGTLYGSDLMETPSQETRNDFEDNNKFDSFSANSNLFQDKIQEMVLLDQHLQEESNKLISYQNEKERKTY